VIVPAEKNQVDQTKAAHNREVVLGALQAAMGGDIDAFLSVLHPDITVHEPLYLPYGGVYKGTDGFLRLLGEATKFLDLAKVKLLAATADDVRTVLLMSVPLVGSGEPVHVTEHWCLVDGLVTDVRVFWFELPDFA
jgi:hypothetical protein